MMNGLLIATAYEEDGLSGEALIDLLGHLHDLLTSAQNNPLLKAKIHYIIDWVEAHMPTPLEHPTDGDQEPGLAYMPELTQLVAQAQQQTQQ